MPTAIYVAMSLIGAALIHSGATSGPPDAASSAIERHYVTGGLFKATRLLALWGVFLVWSALGDKWWLAALLSIPGGASLRFAYLNWAVARARRR